MTGVQTCALPISPEYTEGREGYYWMKKLAGNSAKTVLNMDIRDFTEEGYAYRKAFITEQVRLFNEANNNRAVLEISDRATCITF